MPPSADKPPLDVVAARTAQDIPAQLSTAVDALLPILFQSPRAIGSVALGFPARDLAAIADHGARIIQELAPDTKKPEEAQGCSKTWSMVLCVIVIVVVVIVALIARAGLVFTYGTGALMGAAIGGVIFPLNSAASALVDLLKMAACKGHPLAAEGAAILTQAMNALRNFLDASLIDSTACDKALEESGLALGRLEKLIPAILEIQGQWPGDSQPGLRCCRALSLILGRLADGLRLAHSIPSADAEVVVRALATLRQTLADVSPATPNTST